MIEPIVAQTVSAETLLDALVRILGFCALSAGTAGIAAVVFRWYSADELPDGIGILLGISMVAIWLNTKSALQAELIGDSALTDPETAVYTVVTFVASAVAADAGRRLGDHLATNVFAIATPRTIDDVTQLVRSAGRVVAVDLPEEIEDIDDIEGYDPVGAETKAELAGETLFFPRRLSDEELRERLIDRFKRDYGIGHVDVAFGEDRSIEHLAIGSRPAGIGPTLAPGTVAVALRGDPAADASPGDAVRIWRRDEGAGGDETPFRRVASGELRGAAADVVTVAVDADDATALEPDVDHRLVTLPKNPGAERELVSLLRAADETVTTLEIDPDGALAGASVASLPVLVLAIDRDGAPIALPPAETALESGDVAYVLGRPEALRRVTAPDR